MILHILLVIVLNKETCIHVTSQNSRLIEYNSGIKKPIFPKHDILEYTDNLLTDKLFYCKLLNWLITDLKNALQKPSKQAQLLISAISPWHQEATFGKLWNTKEFQRSNECWYIAEFYSHKPSGKGDICTLACAVHLLLDAKWIVLTFWCSLSLPKCLKKGWHRIILFH